MGFYSGPTYLSMTLKPPLKTIVLEALQTPGSACDHVAAFFKLSASLYISQDTIGDDLPQGER